MRNGDIAWITVQTDYEPQLNHSFVARFLSFFGYLGFGEYVTLGGVTQPFRSVMLPWQTLTSLIVTTGVESCGTAGAGSETQKIVATITLFTLNNLPQLQRWLHVAVPLQLERKRSSSRDNRERMRNELKHYTAEEKVATLRRHLLDKAPVSTLCEELNL